MKKSSKIALITLLCLSPIAIGTLYVLYHMGSTPSENDRTIQYGHYSYYSTHTNQFVSPKELGYYPDRTTGGKPGFSRFFKKSPNAPTNEIEKIVLRKSDFSTPPSSYALYWLGHSSAIVELDGKRLLIDPVLENAAPFPYVVPRYTASPITRENLPDIDIVLITHDHYDHLEMLTMKSLRNNKAKFIVPLGVGARLKGWGVPLDRITEMSWNETIVMNGITITACPMVHYSGRSRGDRNRTLWCGYAIKGEQQNIFWCGDSGYGEHFKEIGEMYGPFDLACVEIDGWNQGWPNTHLFPTEVIEVCKDVQANMLLPVHWGVFDLALHPWTESIDSVWHLASAHNIEIITPLMGEKVLPNRYVSKKWWSSDSATR